MNFLLCENKRIKTLFSSETGRHFQMQKTLEQHTVGAHKLFKDFERKQEAKGGIYKGRKTGV